MELSEEKRRKLLEKRGRDPRGQNPVTPPTVEQLRKGAIEGVSAARDLAAQSRQKAEQIESNPNLSEEGVAAEKERALTPLRDQASAAITRAGEAIDREAHSRGEVLEAREEVDPSALSAKAAALSPVLSAAREDPQALLNAYRARFLDPAARQILEDAAQGLFDAFPAEVAGSFQKRFERVRDELISSYAPAEKEASDAVERLAEAGDHLESARSLVEADFKEVMGEKLSPSEKIGRQRAAAAVNAFESGASRTTPENPGAGEVAG